MPCDNKSRKCKVLVEGGGCRGLKFQGKQSKYGLRGWSTYKVHATHPTNFRMHTCTNVKHASMGIKWNTKAQVVKESRIAEKEKTQLLGIAKGPSESTSVGSYMRYN